MMEALGASLNSQSDSGAVSSLSNGPLNGENITAENEANLNLGHILKNTKLATEEEVSHLSSEKSKLINISPFEQLKHTKNCLNSEVAIKLSGSDIVNMENNTPGEIHTFVIPSDQEKSSQMSQEETDGLDSLNSLNGSAVFFNIHTSKIFEDRTNEHRSRHPSGDKYHQAVNQLDSHDSMLISEVTQGPDKSDLTNGIPEVESPVEDENMKDSEIVLTRDVEDASEDSQNCHQTIKERVILNCTLSEEMSRSSDLSNSQIPTITFDAENLSESDDSNDTVADSILPDSNHQFDKAELSQGISEMNEVLSALSLSEMSIESSSLSKNDPIEMCKNSAQNVGEEIENMTEPENPTSSSHCSGDESLNFDLHEICNKNRDTEISSSIDASNLLGMAHNLPSEIENNLYDASLGLEDIINAAVCEIGLEFNKESEGFLSIDSDSNLVTASEGVISSCSPSTSSENSQQIGESSANCPLGSLQDVALNSKLEENHEFESKEVFGKRGDADGCSLSSEPSKICGSISEDKVPFISKFDIGETILPTQDEDASNCSCKRVEVRPYEENGSVLLGAWSELRSSLRQLHRSVIPSSLSKSGLCNPQNRPSVNRIKALSNMLFSHDPHQLFTRVNQLSQELCIELKVRLLATIHDSPDVDEAMMFIKGLCKSYEWVISVCETIQPAFEKLDADHLSRFGLNWMTVNMHTFHATIFTDPDVQEYLSLCYIKIPKVEENAEGKEVLGCLTSLKHTLSVAETVWARGENHLQEYAVERAALNVQRRQLLSGWEQMKARQAVYGKYPGPNFPISSHSSLDKDASGCNSVENNTTQDQSQQKCPCTDCHNSSNKSHHTPSSSTMKPLNLDSSAKESVKSCECHFCNSSITHSQPPSNPVLSVANSGILPPLSQPQLSLYPHIHGTSANTDITSNHVLDELGPLPTIVTPKPPIFANPYLGSDLLTEQLIREWDLAYGDALAPPGIQCTSSVSSPPMTDTSELSRHLENLSVASQAPLPGNHSVVERSPSLSTAEAHSCVHMSQEKPSVRLNISSSNVAISKTQVTDNCTAAVTASPKYQKEPLQQMIQKQLQQPLTPQPPPCLQQGSANSSVITHTKNCTGVPIPQPPRKPASSESDSSGHEDWSSDDESDAFSTSSSTNHKDSHCDCCYCHMLQNKPGGGRQKYSERRERLLKILSHKRRASSMATVSTASSIMPGTPVPPSTGAKGGDDQLGHQTLDEIINYIEGKKSTDPKCHKKAAKKARQKERKLALKKQASNNKDESRYQGGRVDHDDDNGCYGDESDGTEEEDEEDGPLAELRRRAPDVTITVVKPGQKTANQRPLPKQQLNTTQEQQMTPSNSNVGKHPLVSKPTGAQSLSPASSWNSPRSVLPSGRLSSMTNGPIGSTSKENGPPLAPTSSSGGGLSSLLKGMEVLSKDQSADKDAKSSQMVTIRRVMDPISSEPTVTITLKGEEPKKDKVLFKLVNGQACPGNGVNTNNSTQPAKQKQPQDLPVYNIPEGTSPEEARKIRKKMKKQRLKLRKEQEKIEEEQKEKMKQMEIKKRQEFLKQQEVHIRQQQAALKREQQELLRQQTKDQNESGKKKGKKEKATSNLQSKESAKGKNVSALVYDGDDVARNFSLPPGVSINKVAGQPGMVTISNNMGNPFPQPFLPNPNLYQSNMGPAYPLASHGNSGYPVVSGGSVGYSNMYGGCGGPVPWNGGIDPCTGTPQESVIVVDTNAGITSSKGPKHGQSPTAPKGKHSSSSHHSKKMEEMTPEEKVAACVKGELDLSYLNNSQKKKVKKCLKVMEEEKEAALQKQREEDELMDQMYEISRGRIPNPLKENNQAKKKNAKGKNNSSKQTADNGVSSIKQTQQNPDKKSSKKQDQGNYNTTSKYSSNSSALKNNNTGSTNGKKANESSKDNSRSQAKIQESSTLQQNYQTQSKVKTQQNGAQSTKLTQKQSVQKQPQTKQHQSVTKQQVSLHDQQCAQKQLSKNSQKNQRGNSQQQTQAPPRPQSGDKGQTKAPQTQTKKQKQTLQSHPQQALKSENENPQEKKQEGQNKLNAPNNTSFNPLRLPSNFKGNLATGGDTSSIYSTQMPYEVGSYGPSIGYANNDYGHEARYAQYLAANASTLASMEYETNNPSSLNLSTEDNLHKKGKKKGKRGHLEDLTTIDSVFTPKELPSGELDDETDREVEAFKRFCLYNVPLNTGEKPKVNFNVKDIMIKKKH